MGVPKFYRWISERYPKINQIITDNALLPEFDHLYLDMNGIIHGCTHPPDMDVSEVLSERDMMMGIMHYLDRIITHIVKPKVSVYMAIDGVAPRAKLNQQRSRRYRSARDMAETQQKAMEEQNAGAKQQQQQQHHHQMFDSNCITPGTKFLAQVSDTIRFFIRKKIKEDPAWKNLTVIFSGHDIPGEGEHKIMDHIRQMRSQPHYQPNTRHCIYGQDADLIMLGLVTHEPHFTILREVVEFNFSRSNGENVLKEVKKFTKESDFQLLHLSVLREYLNIEFCRDPSGQQYDLERCIDDFVFITFLVGNDFLPHLPALDIGDGAFDLLFSLYKNLRATTWGTPPGHNNSNHDDCYYLTKEGEILDPRRLETFIHAIGQQETDILQQKKKDEAVYMKKKRRWDKRDGKTQGPSDEELLAVEEDKQSDYQTMINNLLAKVGTDPENFVQGWIPLDPQQQGEDYKGRYYYEKLHFKPTDKEAHAQLRKSYMEGLIWCLAYYYRGCISWGWYYPYHYGPMLSDLIGIPKMFDTISFEMGEPLTPFQQLMACLPPASAELVPKLYRWLMLSPESPIIAFYPESFEVDMNGKKNPWEGVNLLPFIDVKVLKDTIAKHCPDHKLSPVERHRNAFGKVYAYQYDSSCTDTVLSPGKQYGLPNLTNSFSRASVVEDPEVRSPAFQPKLILGTKIPYPGFPSLNVLPIASIDFVSIGLNCFGSPSKYPTCLLTLAEMPELPPLNVLAQNLLGRSLFVNWPMMHEGRVVAISDESQEIRLVKRQHVVKAHSDAAADHWQTETEEMKKMYYVGNGVPGSGGVNIGELKVRLKLLPLQGIKVNPNNGAAKKVFGREEADVPLQLALWTAPAPDPRFQERGPMTLNERFKVGSNVVLTKGKYRGCTGEVVGIVDKKTVGVKVHTMQPEPPFGLAIVRTIQESYISSSDAARILKMHPGLLGKVTGRLSFEQGRYDLGLNLKSPDGMCVVGYTRKRVEPAKNNNKNGVNMWSAGDTLRVIGSSRKDGSAEDRIIWEYTPKAIRLIESYRSKFPQLFSGIAKLPNEKKYNANTVFGPNGESWLPVIREWLNGLESAKLPRCPVTTQSMPVDAVAFVERAAQARALATKKRGFPKDAIIKIPGNAMYLEGSLGATNVLFATDLNNGESPQLGDRVVNLAADGIPFGLRGTVIGIHEAATTGSVEVVMDEEFIGGTTLQGLCSKFRGKLCLWSRLLKISPEDTKGAVDKLVLKGTGKAAAEKIIRSIGPPASVPMAAMPAAAGGKPTRVVDPNNSAGSSTGGGTTTARTAAAAKTTPKTAKAATDQKAGTSTQPTSAAAPRVMSTGRPLSTPKGRQGGWREAKGPGGDDTGFKWDGERNGKNGVSCWKAILKDRQNNAAEILKSKLGITPSLSSSSRAATPFESVGAAAQHLKAVLGMDPSTQSRVESNDAVSNLKSMLGVVPTPGGTSGVSQGFGATIPTFASVVVDEAAMVNPNPTPPPPPPPSSEPLSAADKLLQMMANTHLQQPSPPMASPMYHHPEGPMSHSGFNFTYMEEAQARMMPPPPPHHMMMPPPSFGPYHPGMPGLYHYPGMYPGHEFSPPPLLPPHHVPHGPYHHQPS